MLRQRRTFFSSQDGFAKSMAALTNRIYPDSPLSFSVRIARFAWQRGRFNDCV
jgi:hypothetical protein